MKANFTKSIDVVSLKLIRESNIEVEFDSITDQHLAIKLFQEQLGLNDRETFSVLCLDSKGYPTNYSIAHIGTLNNTIISNREIFKVAVLSNANSIIVAHNHPSGNGTPSKGDISNTKLIVEAGEILGIKVLDHIVISDTEGVSIRNLYPHIFEC
jgi:DNA repair protein RadC